MAVNVRAGKKKKKKKVQDDMFGDEGLLL